MCDRHAQCHSRGWFRLQYGSVYCLLLRFPFDRRAPSFSREQQQYWSRMRFAIYSRLAVVNSVVINFVIASDEIMHIVTIAPSSMHRLSK